MFTQDSQGRRHSASSASFRQGERMLNYSVECVADERHAWLQCVRVQRGNHCLHNAGIHSRVTQHRGTGHGIQRPTTQELQLCVCRVRPHRVHNRTHAVSGACACQPNFAPATADVPQRRAAVRLEPSDARVCAQRRQDDWQESESRVI
jgi:hypothetical protein